MNVGVRACGRAGVWGSRIWRTVAPGMAVLLLILCTSPAWAQSDVSAGERYFHRAAQQYVGENLSEAQRLVTEGLQADPGHPKLLALREKLRQQRKAQSKSDDANRQDGSSQQQGGQQKSQQQGNQQQGQQRGRQDPRHQRSGERGQQQPPEDAPDAQRQQQSEAAQQQARRRADGSTERRPEGLSREQAARILQALEGQEKQLLREVQKRPATETDVEKDW